MNTARQNLPLCGSISGFCSNKVSRNRKATGMVFAGPPDRSLNRTIELLSISMIPAEKVIIKDLRETTRACYRQ